MNKVIRLLILLAPLAVILHSCKNDEQGASQGEGVISGTVVDATTSAALGNVTITAQVVSSAAQQKTTDATGTFRFSFPTDSSKSVTVLFQKSGFHDTSFVVTITPGTVTALTIALTPTHAISTEGGSGVAASIALMAPPNPQAVSVYGVGGIETTYLHWEVHDSLGLPIDAAHAVTMLFSITNGPGGGEYVSPQSVTTNAQGQATIAFNSGIRAGVAQIMATTTVHHSATDSTVIWSTPVRVIVRAGLPDQPHFTIAPAYHNFPALHWVGRTLGISVLVGDKYSNPVEDHTAVYFSSTAGVIEAAVFTLNGAGTVNLRSGNPLPFGIYAASPDSGGYHYVTSRTVGENAVTVTDRTLLLWSGYTEIGDFSPSTINVPSNGSQTVNFRVSDELGHPLSHGTTITVTGSGSPFPVNVYFGQNGSVVLDDYMTPGWGTTLFSFTVADAADTVGVSSVNVQIAVQSDNGNVYTSIGGISH